MTFSRPELVSRAPPICPCQKLQPRLEKPSHEALQSYSASEYGKWQIELINGKNEECYKWTWKGRLFQKSFEHGTTSEQEEAARALVAACGDYIYLAAGVIS